MTRFGPDEQWPEHDDDYWNRVLNAARARGFTLIRHSAHSWGSLKCPSNICTYKKIFSTGKGSESVAMSMLRKVERDPCTLENEALAAAGVKQHLGNGSRLCDAAESLIRRDAAEERIVELVEMADDNLRAAHEITTAFDLAAEESRAAAERAKEQLSLTPQSTEERPEPVLDAAAVEADSAAEEMNELAPTHSTREALEADLHELQARVAHLKGQVRGGPADDR